MLSRRVLVALLATVLSSPVLSQPSASAFVGTWKGDVPGVSQATLVITAVKANGQVEGRMEFAVQSQVFTFADKADMAAKTNLGTVSGPDLTIESALGGRYILQLGGGRLVGKYVRGTTYDVPVNLGKSG